MGVYTERYSFPGILSSPPGEYDDDDVEDEDCEENDDWDDDGELVVIENEYVGWECGEEGGYIDEDIREDGRERHNEDAGDGEDPNPFCPICRGSVNFKDLWWISVLFSGMAIPVKMERAANESWKAICPKCAGKISSKLKTNTPEFNAYRGIYLSRKRRPE
jgi:hypothetical protein